MHSRVLPSCQEKIVSTASVGTQDVLLCKHVAQKYCVQHSAY